MLVDVTTAPSSRVDTDSASSRSGGTDPLRSERGVVRQQRQSVEHAEHLGDLARFRAGIAITAPTWCVFGVLDWFTARWASQDSGTLLWLWSIRWGLLPLIGLTFWAVHRVPPISPRQLRALDFLLYGAAAYGIALMAVGYHGISSHYIAGILMAQIGRSAFSAQPWRRAAWSNLVIASSFPIVMGIAACFMPSLRAQLRDPAALAPAIQNLCFLYGTAVMGTAATHYAWTLRRQLFESRSIGRYRLQRRLAGGGMGEVWAAYHPGLKRDIALKMLRPEANRDESAVARFEYEVKATSELSHPNTIRVFDFGVTDDGIFYYAMELLEGRTLSELVRAEGALPPARAAHLIVQVARSLAEAHQTGLVHRDIKPANLFVTKAGGEPDFVKVLDFGIAKRIEGPIDSELTHPGVLAGTPKYMALELMTGAAATPRSDVYGIGAVAFFLLTGRAPFEGKTAEEVFAAQRAGVAPRVSAARGEGVDGALERVIERCLSHVASERYADAGELAAALADLDLRWSPQRPSLVPSPVPPSADDPTKITAL